MKRQYISAALSLFIASTVLLSSLHASQVMGAVGLDDAKKSQDDSKVVHDLHHHSDKSGTQLIKDVTDHSKYFDSRTRHVVRDKKGTIRDKLARWQRAWEEFLMSYHMV